MDDKPMQTMNQASSNKMWYIIGAIVVVIAALAIWYFSMQSPSTGTQASAVQQNQAPALSSGNTTADIQADLSQTPNDSAALNQDAAASNQDIKNF